VEFLCDGDEVPEVPKFHCDGFLRYAARRAGSGFLGTGSR
jgi:hypothetical protein